MGLISTTPEISLERAAEPLRFGPKTSMSEKLLAIAIRAQNFTGSTGVAIALTEGSEMVCRASWGTSSPDVGVRLSLEEKSFTGQCVRSGQPLRCDDSETDPRVDAAACRALGVRAIAVAPVRQGPNITGVIAAFSDTPRAFSEKHVLILTTLAEVIAGYLEEGHPADALSAVTASESKPDVPTPSPNIQPETLPVASVSPAEKAAQIEPPRAPVHESKPPQRPALEPATVTTFFPQQPQVQRETVAASPGPGVAAPAKPPEIPPARVQGFREDVLVSAMDPLPPGARSAAKVPSITRAPLSTLSKQKMPLEDLGAADYEQDWERKRKLVLAAAAVAVFAVLGLVGWKLSHRSPKPATPAAVTSAAAEPSAPPAAIQPTTPPETIVVEDETRVVGSAGAPAAKVQAARLSAASGSPATAKQRVAEPVVEALAEPVRQPSSAPPATAIPQHEEQAPQLALASPPIPSGLTKTSAAAPLLISTQAAPAELIHRVPPQYPAIAKQFQMSGTVVLSAKVLKDGKIGEVQFVRGDSLFRDSAIAAVKQWRFKPAQLNGQVIESTTEIVVQFNPPAR